VLLSALAASLTAGVTYGKYLKTQPHMVPNRGNLKELGRQYVASNVNEEDARWVRKTLLPKELTKGGAAFHRKRPQHKSKILKT
jgi:hypothetical protein